MSIFLKRYFWIVPLVTTMLCSYLAARGATAVIDAKIAGDDDAPRLAPSRSRKPVAPPAPARSKDAEVVVKRNMFCSTCEPPVVDPLTPVDPSGRPPNTSLPLILSATVVASIPTFSSATIINTASFRSGSYGVDDEIPEAGPI